MSKFVVSVVFAFGVGPAVCAHETTAGDSARKHKARNVILFVGDGMGVSTVTAARIYSKGVAGELVLDTMPYTALSRVFNADHITPDSAGTITAMLTGVNANMGVLGFGAETEPRDFNNDGDGPPLWTIAELAKRAGMKVGVVSTARVTHATPAGTFAHVNNRNLENDIALQALPSDEKFNKRIKGGLDIWMGGGRRHFFVASQVDEEGDRGKRTDGRDLREEFQKAGYSYVWNEEGFSRLKASDLPVLGLFENSHMEYEFDRKKDKGKEPSLTAMTVKSIEWLSEATKNNKFEDRGYFLLVEAGRIDHAHHWCNAFRALHDTQEMDRALGAAIDMVDLKETLILATADHSHVMTIAGYPAVEAGALPYKPKSAPPEYTGIPHHNILDVVYTVNHNTGHVEVSKDKKGVPYTILSYSNGPGYREGSQRIDPRTEPSDDGTGPNVPSYMQETMIPRGSETHAGEDVVIYAIGAGAEMVHGTVKNTFVFDVMSQALGLQRP